MEIAGAVAGLLVGLAAAALMGVYRSPKTGAPVSRAGVVPMPASPACVRRDTLAVAARRGEEGTR